MGLIKDHSQDAIVNNPAIPNDQNDSAMETILGAITGGLQQQAQGNGIASVMGLLGGQGGASGSTSLMSNPIVANIAQQAVSSLMQKFGIGNSAASNIVSQVLPGVISSVISKTNDPNDSSLNIQDFVGAFSDGKLDMNDISNIAGKLMGGGGQQGQAGGLGGLLGGLFK